MTFNRNWWQDVDWTDPIDRGHPLLRDQQLWLMAAPDSRLGWGTFTWRDMLRRFNGTLTGMDPATDWGAFNGTPCLDFDGTDDYVNNVGGLADFSFIQNTMQFTLEFRIAVRSNTTRYIFAGTALASAEKGFFVSYEYGAGIGTAAFRLGLVKGTGGTSQGAWRTPDNVISDTGFHTVRIVGEGPGASGIRFWVDGVEYAATNGTPYTSLSSGDSTRTLNVGRGNHSSHLLSLDGAIASCRIWSRPITTHGNIPMPLNRHRPRRYRVADAGGGGANMAAIAHYYRQMLTQG